MVHSWKGDFFMTPDTVAIRVAPAATGLQRFAADELRRYLVGLFGLQAGITTDASDGASHRFVLGLTSDACVRETARPLPDLSDQGHLLRRVAPDAMVLAGGSPAALCWAVYELIERYGVRYLLHEDIFPAEPGAFHIPDIDETMEPLQKQRCWRVFCTLPTGPAVWSLAQQKAFMTQLFKLRFNGVSLGIFPPYPAVIYEVDGIRRRTAATLQGERIPVDRDTIGREHLPDIPYLDNPDLAAGETFEEKHQALRRLLHGIIEHARGLGMRIGMWFNPFEFPLEFQPLLQKPTTKSIQLGGLTCAEQGDLGNPKHMALVSAKFEAFLDEYGSGLDSFGVGFPEHPYAQENFMTAWKGLAAKYGLEPDFDADALVAASRTARFCAGGPERAEREFKSVVSMLHFYDRFFDETRMIERMADRGVGLLIGIGCNGAYEALSVIDRILWPGASLGVTDYTTSRLVRKLQYLETIDASRVPVSVTVTLQDDNIGWVPQVATENIHILLETTRRLGWRGYTTRYWPIGDLDPPAAYLARASWNVRETPRTAYEDHFSHACGPAAVEPMCQVMRLLEDATLLLEVELGSLLFPVLGIMKQHVTAEAPAGNALRHVHAIYGEVLRKLHNLRDLADAGSRAANLDYWISRLEFAVAVLDEISLLRSGGAAVHSAETAEHSGDKAQVGEYLARAQRLYDEAVAAGERALRAAAEHVRDDSDRGCIASYYHFLVREAKQLTREFMESCVGQDA